MALPEINLDDRRFAELVDEAKRRIPRYTPEWTDWNPSDPGIVLVELFAWLTELALYRINQVPEKNYGKFLELIGIQRKPPTPARAALTFKLTSKDLPQAVRIPQGTRVALSESADGEPVIFETDDNLLAAATELKALQSFDGARFKLLGEEQRVAGKFFYALGERPQRGSAFYLGWSRAFPAGRHRLLVYVFVDDLIAEGQGIAATAPDLPPPVQAVWEFWAGEGAGWRTLEVIADETASLTRSGYLQFEAPAPGAHVAVRYGLLQSESDEPLFWLRYRIEQELGAGYEIPPRVEEVLANTIPASQVQTIQDELLGASTGLPDQSFQLAKTPVLPGTLVLEVDEGQGPRRWQEVPDFAGSSPEDQHFTLDWMTGRITFGNGEQGKIPLLLLPQVDSAPLARQGGNSQRDALPNLRARSYRWGGGLRGNAGAGTITGLQSSVPFVESVTNLRPATGGEDAETVEAAKARAPEMIRSRSRAVTAEDFEFLARETPGARIRRAKTLPLHHPQFTLARAGDRPLTAVPIPGVVTVVVVPESLQARPLPAPEVLQQVARWLKDHSLVTTEIYAAAPRYREVEIEARLLAAPSASSGAVQEGLTRMLLDYFHPLKGGATGQGWDFGGTISFAEVYRRLLDFPGVLRLAAESLKIFVDGQLAPACRDIALGPDELVTSSRHSLTVSYETAP